MTAMWAANTIKQTTTILAMTAMAFTASAATYTWDGGGADSNWSTTGNWDPDTAAPVSASDTTVRLDGIVRTSPAQDIANPFVLNRLEFLDGPNIGVMKASLNLSGSPLQFVANGATQPRIFLNRNASCYVANAIDIPAGTTLELEIGTWEVVFTGVLSGEGGIDKLLNAGGIWLQNSANSFSGGLTIRAQNSDWCKANVSASGAMGTGPVNLYGGSLDTTFSAPGGLIFL